LGNPRICLQRFDLKDGEGILYRVAVDGDAPIYAEFTHKIEHEEEEEVLL
jgi:hypothetical protein